MLERLTVPLLVACGVLLLIWYVAGNEIMRRRGRRLAVWCKRVADPMSPKQAIQWYTLSAFRLDVEDAGAPFRSAALTGLTESWDVPFIWLWNRLNWRRDMVQVQLVLGRQPVWGLELYRPRSVLAGDARHAASRESWVEVALDEFRVAPADGPGFELAHKLLAELGEQRRHLIRISVRRRETHLSLALNVPCPEAWPPEEFHALLERLAAAVLHSPAAA